VIAFVDKAVYESDKRLIDAGIPAINVHTAVSKEELPGLLGWVAGDAHAYAVACAEAMGEKLKGEGTVIVSQLNLNDLENQVTADFTKTINEKYPKIVVLPTILEGADQPAAIAIAEAALLKNPEISGAFGTTGNSPVTWAKALEAQGKKPGDVIVIGMDTVRQNLDLVESGWVYAVVAQPLYSEEYKAVELLLANLKGETVKYENEIEAPLVKKGETAKYYEIVDRVDAGGKK
jgi:ribose transport system substrate-binding protein